MKKYVLGILAIAIAVTFISAQASAAGNKYRTGNPSAATETEKAAPAEKTEKPGAKHKHVTAADFPEKGWHKGPYLAANVGMMQVTNDNHIITGVPFDGKIDPAFGISFGWDIADWIGPLLQMNFATATGTTGDPNGGNNGGAAYPSQPNFTFPVGTFPVENARQYVLDFGLYAKATLPYFVRAEWQPKMVKIIPFAKLGATVNAVFVNAPTNANKAGALGGGPAIGLGCEFFIWKGFFVAIDATEHLMFQKAFSKNITTANAGSVNFQLTQGGFKPHFTLAGLFGWHF